LAKVTNTFSLTLYLK